MVSSHPKASLMVRFTLLTLYIYPMVYNSHSFVTKNGQKLLKNMFLEMFTSITSYSTYIHVLWAKEWCSVILWYHLWCLLHSWPHIVILWATIATHLWAKMKENGWKQVFDDTYLHNLLFYTQICSIGQWVMFNYPMVSPKVPTTLMTPYSCPMGHYSHSFVSKNGRKRLKTGFWRYLPP